MSTTTQYATRIELRGNETDHSPSACIYIANGNLVIETLNGVGLRFVSSGSVHTETPAGDATWDVAGTVKTVAGGNIEACSGADIWHCANQGVHTDAGTGGVTVQSAADVLHTTAGEHRIEATDLDLHARSILREDAGGVGHSYVAQNADNGHAQVHYWTPWHGTGNDPHPPEHPRIGTGDATCPPIDDEPCPTGVVDTSGLG